MPNSNQTIDFTFDIQAMWEDKAKHQYTLLIPNYATESANSSEFLP